MGGTRITKKLFKGKPRKQWKGSADANSASLLGIITQRTGSNPLGKARLETGCSVTQKKPMIGNEVNLIIVGCAKILDGTQKG